MSATQITLDEVPNKINEFEQILTKWFHKDIFAEHNRQVDEFNAWLDATKTELDARKAHLDREFENLKTGGREALEMQSRLSTKPQTNQPSEGDAYNRKGNEFNQFKRQHNEASEAYMRRQEEDNDPVRSRNKEDHEKT